VVVGEQAPGSLSGVLVSVAAQMEGSGQVQGGLVERQAVQRGPEVESIPMDGAVGLEAVKDVLAEMDREGVLTIGILPALTNDTNCSCSQGGKYGKIG
jgi:hypothetical protein